MTIVDCDWKHILLLIQSFTDDELSEVSGSVNIVLREQYVVLHSLAHLFQVLHVAMNRKPHGDSNVTGWYKEVCMCVCMYTRWHLSQYCCNCSVYVRMYRFKYTDQSILKRMWKRLWWADLITRKRRKLSILFSTR